MNNPRYQEWLNHVFDHEVRKREWYFDEDKPEFEASPIETVELIGQTFLRAGKDLAAYTDEKVDQGIWYFAGMSGSDFMLALKAPEVPLMKRLEAMRSRFAK
jgi:hypothetical protein